MKTTIAISLALAAAMPTAWAQDPDAAAERARLANQRIIAESEQRKREEPDVAEPEPQEPPPEPRAPATPASPEGSPTPDESGAVTPESASGDRMSVVLEQLRTLGELKDAGYVSDDEFDRIKRRILDENL